MLPKIKRDKSPAEALSALMRLCARAEKSSGDALRLMYTWGVEESQRSGVLCTLLEQHFIDDERFAEAFVREKVRLSGWGHYKIEAALRRKGVAKELICKALEQTDRDGMAQRLAQQFDRKKRTVKYASPYELKTKLIRYGLSLGYDYDTVLEVASSQINNTEECDDFI